MWKSLKRFNELIRKMKANRNMLWILLLKAIAVQLVLIGLVFINRESLGSVVNRFTSATSEVSDRIVIIVTAETSFGGGS
jgi:hypothetical protein